MAGHSHDDEVTLRLQLVNRYNALTGQPDVVMSEMQRAFVYGRMTSEDAASFVDLHGCLIRALEAVRRS